MMDDQSTPRRPTIRLANESDLSAILAIYNDVIATTTAVYTEEPVDLTERGAWFAAKVARGFPTLVAAREEEVLGFATFGDFRTWPCYSRTVEHSVHVRADARGQGLGGALIAELLTEATASDVHVMIAGIDADNIASINLHRKLGFVEAGVLREVGRKFGRWLDLMFMQKVLTSTAPTRES